ncbi:MAG TPA: zf-HC2 domain-containing protein [Planctomycetota bacterium]
MERVCPETDVLGAWIEGGLAAPERAEVKAHLAVCDDCRRAASLSATLEPAEAAAGAVDEIFIQRLANESRRRPRWPWMASAAAAALFAAGTVVLVTRPSPAPRPTPAAPRVADLPRPAAHVAPPAIPPVVPTPEVVKGPEPTPAPPKAVEDPKPIIAVPVPLPSPEPPAPPKPAPAPTDVAKPAPTPATETDLALVFMPVFAVDPTGDLWLRRDGADAAKAGAFESVAYKDVFAARGDAAAFTIESRASVALEKGAEAAVSWFKVDGAFRLDVVRGPVYLDTESNTQKWLLTAGLARMSFAELTGRVLVERRDDVLSVLLLDGKGVLEDGRRTVEPGREVVLARDGKVDLRKGGPAADKLARFMKIRPRTSTAFAASFEEKKDVVQPFPYTVTMGRVVMSTTTAGAYLEAARPSTGLAAALKPARPIAASEGMVLRFRYRTNLPVFFVKVSEPAPEGKEREYVAKVEVKGRTAVWTEAELPLAGLSDEGVPVVPTTSMQEIRFQGVPTGGKSGLLEVDSVQFLRRAR